MFDHFKLFHQLRLVGLAVILVWLTITTSITSITSITQAQTPTASSSTSKLKERIERIVNEKRDQIKGVLAELDQAKRGTIGEVIRVSSETLTIKTAKGTEILPLTDQIRLLKKNKVIKLEDVAVGDWAVVMGVITDETFQPQKILISSTSLRPLPHLVRLGSIEKIEAKSLSISDRSQDQTQTFLTNSQTKYQNLNGQTVSRKQLSEKTQVLLVGFENTDRQAIVTTIRLLTTVTEQTNNPTNN